MMKVFNVFIQMVLLLLTWGCKNTFENKIDLSGGPTPTVRSVKIQNHQLVLEGQNLDKVINVKVKNNAFDESFVVESATASRLVANGLRNISFLVERTFNLILSTAYGSATYQISFTITNGQVTAAMLNHMGATTGQFLRFNGTNWAPASVTDSQIFAGTWDANANDPDLSSPSTTAGEYYIVSVAGTFNAINFNVGDWIISNGTSWEKLEFSGQAVSSFHGRQGAVTLRPTDYVSLIDGVTQKIPGSSLDDVADVDLTGLAAGKILKFDGTNWIVADDDTLLVNSVDTNSIQNGAVTYTKLSLNDGDIPQAKVNGLVAALAAKEPAIAAGASTQYIRGDKTLSTFASDVRATVMTGLSTATNAVITAADSLLSALGKLQAQVNDIISDSANYLVKNGSDSITGTVTVTGAGSLQVPDPVLVNEAASKQYVDNNTVANAGGAASVQIGTLAARPAAAAGNTGRIYVANDSGNEAIFVSTGTTWVQIASNSVTGTVPVANGGTGSTSFTANRAVVVNATADALVDGPAIDSAATASSLVQRGTAGEVAGNHFSPQSIAIENDDCSLEGVGAIAVDANGNLLTCQN
jgi:hypothetical protein